MHAVADDELVELIAHARSPGVEVLGVGRRPPIRERAVAVKVPSAIVECVRHLVTHDDADRAVIRGVVEHIAKERRLQNAGVERDVVCCRVIAGVHGRRRRVPARAVEGLAEIVEPAANRCDRRVDAIRRIGVASDRDVTVIAWMIRIADLDGHEIELLHGDRAGVRAHPRERGEIVVQGLFDGVDHGNGACALFRREVLPIVDDADRVAQVAGGRIHAPLRARSLLDRAAEHGAEEVERFVVERLRQRGRIRTKHVPAQHRCDIGRAAGGKRLREGREVGGLSDVDRAG